MTTQKNIPEIETLIRQFHHPEGSALNPLAPDDRPLHGRTLHLASCDLAMRPGDFRAHIFQDIIDKHCLIALAHGDITTAAPLHVRLHSSCVTSETLRGCDCDCVGQLDAALELIAKKGRGILFYLMQEGRGVGYAAKARDRMLVQASADRLTTFDAYAAMGLQKDHRHYDNISQICHLLGVRAPFHVLTNNPDKVAALRAQGIRVASTEPLEIEPSPFNLAYLASKATRGGHNLKRPAASKVRRAAPPEPVTAFRPRALAGARRFILFASYFLPVKPVDDNPAAAKPGKTAKAPRLEPHWFRAHVYYDIVTSQEYIVLTHGEIRAGDTPVVRLHSEAIFERFPLRSAANRDKLKQSIRRIVAHGAGLILLLHNDGRGAGFGACATDLMLTQTGQAAGTDDAYRKLGVTYDSRDYDAAMLLLKHHIPGEKIQMLMNSPDSLVKKNEYIAALNKHAIDVERWIFLD